MKKNKLEERKILMVVLKATFFDTTNHSRDKSGNVLKILALQIFLKDFIWKFMIKYYDQISELRFLMWGAFSMINLQSVQKMT